VVYPKCWKSARRCSVMRMHDLEVGRGVTVRVVEKRAAEDGSAVLLVHGLGVGGGYWDLPVAGYSTMDYLVGRGLRAYSLDNRGYGHSTPVSGSSVRAETAVRDVAQVIGFIRSRSGAERVCLVGHSWGAMVAAMTAAAYPAIVDSLVLIGMPYRRLHRQFEERLDDMRTAGTPVDGWMPNLTHLGLEERLFAYDPEVLDAYMKMVETDYPRIPLGILDDCQELPHVDSPARIVCPVLVVSGTRETVVDHTDTLDLLDDIRSVEKEFVLVGNVGHLAGLEKLAHRRIDRMVADRALGGC
jgi:pimeloyl-ACP methyl ester carboxylesterase